MMQSMNGKQAFAHVFEPKVDILNIRCDYQFVFSVLEKLYVSHVHTPRLMQHKYIIKV